MRLYGFARLLLTAIPELPVVEDEVRPRSGNAFGFQRSGGSGAERGADRRSRRASRTPSLPQMRPATDEDATATLLAEATGASAGSSNTWEVCDPTYHRVIMTG